MNKQLFLKTGICTLVAGTLSSAYAAHLGPSIEQILAGIRSVTCEELLQDGGPRLERLPIGTAVVIDKGQGATSAPKLGRYLGIGKSGGALIRFAYHAPAKLISSQILGNALASSSPPSEFLHLSTEDIEVSKEHIHLTHGGFGDQSRNRIAELSEIQLQFNPGEVVRYRGQDQLMHEAVFVSQQGNLARLQQRNQLVETKSSFVFKKFSNGRAFTPDLSHIWWTGIPFERPSGLVLEMLNGLARFSSLPDFLQLTSGLKIYTLVELFQTLMPFSKAALNGEMNGFLSFENYVEMGTGNCRHLGVILATALSEMGFSTSLVSLQKILQPKHLWLEAAAQLKDGRAATYIVDSTLNWPLVLTAEELKDWAKSDPHDQAGIDSVGYLASERTVYQLSPKE